MWNILAQIVSFILSSVMIPTYSTLPSSFEIVQEDCCQLNATTLGGRMKCKTGDDLCSLLPAAYLRANGDSNILDSLASREHTKSI